MMPEEEIKKPEGDAPVEGGDMPEVAAPGEEEKPAEEDAA